MLDRLQTPVLALLRVPPAPSPPAGASGSLRLFRAAPRYFRYRQAVWALKQLGALAALVGGVLVLTGVVPVLELVQHGPLLVPVLKVAEAAAWALFLLQLPVSYAVLQLDYRMRWYMVTDRSLRVREGIWTLREKTMTFANIQSLTVEQGPVQRLLGLADLKVQSAGGGGGMAAQQAQGGHRESAHEARFRGVGNAAEIRELIRERVRQFRDAGLGDHDDRGAPKPEVPPAVAAAGALLTELRALRGELGPKS